MVTSLTSIPNCTFKTVLLASGEKTVTGFDAPISGNVDLTRGGSLSYGTTPPAINEVISLIATLATGTLNLQLSGTYADICNQAAATLTKIVGLQISLLATADDSGLGSATTFITLGFHATLAWAPILGATGTYIITNGSTWWHYDPAGLTVGATDVLKIVNGHAASAGIQISFLGVG